MAPQSSSARPRMSRVEEAVELMRAFAERTGLTSARPQQRYLWTDAFAVCNLLGLARRTGDAEYSALALRLIDAVHHTLGKHRPDDGRTGWLSGLGDAEGELHPTRGGLRIGKPLPERRVDEPFDEQREWDRDGQYFHYLTKWMHALDRAARTTAQPRYNLWALELAKVAYQAFTARTATSERMIWKMSIDLSRPLVASMGQHDPLDGLITSLELEGTASRLFGGTRGVGLQAEVKGFAAMAETMGWATADPLGLGGLLADVCRVAQATELDRMQRDGLVGDLLKAALQGLPHYATTVELRWPASMRLAFRELGLAIGLHAIDLVKELPVQPEGCAELLAELSTYRSLGAAIESFWLQPENRRSHTWVGHRDINEVMLATCLVPDGFLR